MNILVTGANGQLGLEIQKIVNKMGNGHPDHDTSEKNYYIFAGHNDLDITDKEAVIDYIKKNHINIVINCAAYTAVDKAEEDSETASKINFNGPENLAEAVQTNGGVLLHISTDYVFNGRKNGLYNEEDNPDPQSTYGATKRLGEIAIEKSGCNYMIFRTSWLYGGDKKNFVKTMFNLISSKDKLSVVNDQVGNPTYVVDLAEFLIQIIENNNAENRYLSKTGIYHFSNFGKMSWYDLTCHIYKARIAYDKDFIHECIIRPCTTEEYPTLAQRPANSAFDLTKLRNTFDYEPKDSIMSLYRCVEKYVKENNQ